MPKTVRGYVATSERSRGWLRYLYRKATTPDNWDKDGEAHPHWDAYTREPTASWARMDLRESSHAMVSNSRQSCHPLSPSFRGIELRKLPGLESSASAHHAGNRWTLRGCFERIEEVYVGTIGLGRAAVCHRSTPATTPSARSASMRWLDQIGVARGDGFTRTGCDGTGYYQRSMRQLLREDASRRPDILPMLGAGWCTLSAMAPEAIVKSDGSKKNDCERNAANLLVDGQYDVPNGLDAPTASSRGACRWIPNRMPTELSGSCVQRAGVFFKGDGSFDQLPT